MTQAEILQEVSQMPAQEQEDLLIAIQQIIRRKPQTSQERDTRPTKPSTQSLADRLEGYIGVIDSSEYVDGLSNLSENTGEKFAQLLLQK